MFKFLRRYNKWILAVGGTLLMIVFLVPQAIDGLSQGAAISNAPRASYNGANGEVTVTESELQVTQGELTLMDRLGLPIPVLGRVENPWHWHLLTLEAQQAGIIGGSGATGLDPLQVQALQARSGTRLSGRQIEELLARISGVERMFVLYQTAGQFSDRRLRTVADRLFYVAQAQSVVIQASDEAIDEMPTEAEIKAQMEAYADIDPGDPDSPFGYRLPDRVKLEWLTVSADSVRAAIEASDAMNGLALRKHWRLNAGTNNFPAIPEVPATEVPEVVRLDLLEQLTTKKIDEIERAAYNLLRTETHALKRSNGYLQLPENWTTMRLDFNDLAGTIVERFGIERPTYEATGDRWLTAADLRELEGIGPAGTDKYPPRRLTVSTLVPLIKEFEGSSTILLQEGVAGPSLRDADGSLYFYRVIATDKSRAPANVDEVRESVVKDLKRKRDYDRLVAELPQLKARAVRESLTAVAMDHDTVMQAAQAISMYDPVMIQIQTATRQPLTPVPSNLPVIGPHEETVEAIVDYARKTIHNDTLDQLTEAQRIIALPVEDKLSVIIVRLLHEVPFSEATYTTRVSQNQIQQVLLNEELSGGDTIREAFSFDALKKRHGFKDLSPARSETQPDALATVDTTTE